MEGGPADQRAWDDDRVNQPYGAFRRSPQGPPQPGILPLRPLSAGEILSAAVVVVKRHFMVLGPIAAVASLLSGLTEWAILAASGSVDDFTNWSTNMFDGGTDSGHRAGGVAGLVHRFGALRHGVIRRGDGVRGSGHHGRSATARRPEERLAGRWLVLIGLAVVVGIGVTVGFVLLIVPGILLYVAWSVATPAAVMERADVTTALRRSVLLTAGLRARVLGLTLAPLATAFLLSALISVMVVTVAGQLSTNASMLTSVLVSALVASFTSSWLAAVIALYYVDLRIRKEGLGEALAAAR